MKSIFLVLAISPIGFNGMDRAISRSFFMGAEFPYGPLGHRDGGRARIGGLDPRP